MVRSTWLLLAAVGACGGGPSPRHEADQLAPAPPKLEPSPSALGPGRLSSLSQPEAPTADLAAAAAEIERLAIVVYRRQAKHSESFAFSPASFGLVMSLLRHGARGATAVELQDRGHAGPGVAASARALTTRLGDPGWHPGADLRSFRAVYVDPTVTMDEGFRALARDGYGMDPVRIDFVSQPASAFEARVDADVGGATGGRITNVLQSRTGSLLPSRTRLAVVDALSLVGRPPFNPALTMLGRFQTPTGTIDHPMMRLGVADFPLGETVDAQILQLPIGGDELILTVVLPKRPVVLAALEARIDRGTLVSWRDSLVRQPVTVTLPRFAIRSLLNNSTLSAIGVLQVMASDAELVGIGRVPEGGDRLHLGLAAHIVQVEISDGGGRVGPTPPPARRPRGQVPAQEVVSHGEFVADRPFLFLIEDRVTGAVLVMGRVASPVPG